MKYLFSTAADAIILDVDFNGPTGIGTARLALDTGANQTMISVQALASAGYGPSTPMQPIRFMSATGIANAVILEVAAFRALGQEVLNFPIVAHTLPLGSNIDGLLGLDFFRGKELTLDFRNGFISLN